MGPPRQVRRADLGGHRLLTTLEGHYLRAGLLGCRRLTRQLERKGARRDSMALFGVVEAAFVMVLGHLSRYDFRPTDLPSFAAQAARLTSTGREPVTADEVARLVRHELGQPVSIADIEGYRDVPVRRAVIGTAVRHLRFTLHDLDNLLRKAELLAAQWGFAATPYHPGPMTGVYGMVAGVRWSGWQARRSRHERIGSVL